MLRFLADENIESQLISAIRRDSDMDIVRIQDVDLLAADDPAILEWAAQEGRILLTHDVKTMATWAYARVGEGLPMPGILEVPQAFSVGQVAEEITLMAHFSPREEMEGRVAYLRG